MNVDRGEGVDKGTALTPAYHPFHTEVTISPLTAQERPLPTHVRHPHCILVPSPALAMTTEQTLLYTRSESPCASRQVWRVPYAHTVQPAPGSHLTTPARVPACASPSGIRRRSCTPSRHHTCGTCSPLDGGG